MSTRDFVDEPQSDPEAMLAYWVENASPGDPNVLSVLVERYALPAREIIYFCMKE